MTSRTFRPATLPLAAALLVTACADPSGSSDQPLGALMVGEWTHSRILSTRSDAPANLGFSASMVFSVSIVIDSARDMQFWGHVARWFVGDVGLPASRFGLVSGTIDSGYAVVLQIAPGSTPGWTDGALTIEGEVAGDLLSVHSSWAGADQGPFPLGCRFRRLQ
jgi:hypothetical protein